MAKNPQNKSLKQNQPNTRMIDMVEENEKIDEPITPEDGASTTTETEVGDGNVNEPTELNGGENENVKPTETNDAVKPNTEIVQDPSTPSEESKPEDIDIVKKEKIEKEIKELEKSLLEYGSLMNKKCVYSRITSPQNQKLIIAIIENIFVETLDYQTMYAKVKFITKFAADLAKTDDNWLGESMAFRGLESVQLPKKRIENYSFLLNMIIRFNEWGHVKDQIKYFSWENTLKYHPRPITRAFIEPIMMDLYKSS